jgi:DNA-binding MarR family transcriptional regulator
MQLTEVQALELWRGTIVAGVRHDVPDLSARQMAVLLTVYLKPPPHTVRGLASALNISKPAITRSLDRLSDLGLLGRKIDEADRRSVLIQRTLRGSVFLREYGEIIVAAGHKMHDQRESAGIIPFEVVEVAASHGIA